MYIFLVGEEPYCRELFTYQIEIKRGLHLSVVNIKSEIGVQIQWHQQLSLRRKTISGGSGFALNHYVALLNSSCDKPL